MLEALFVLLVLVTFVPLMLAATAGRQWPPLLGSIEALILLAGAGYHTLIAFVLAALKCDESCHSQEGWQGDPEAWQWTAQFVIALLELGCAFAAAVLVFRRLYRAAIPAVVGGLACFVAWALVAEGPLDDLLRAL